jgi:hypothetical protein
MSNQDMNQSGQDLGGMQQQAQDAINNEIDQFANKVPGGEQAAQQAKDAAGSGLDQIAQQAQSHEGDLPGGLGEKLDDMMGRNQ